MRGFQKSGIDPEGIGNGAPFLPDFFQLAENLAAFFNIQGPIGLGEQLGEFRGSPPGFIPGASAVGGLDQIALKGLVVQDHGRVIEQMLGHVNFGCIEVEFYLMVRGFFTMSTNNSWM